MGVGLGVGVSVCSGAISAVAVPEGSEGSVGVAVVAPLERGVAARVPPGVDVKVGTGVEVIVGIEVETLTAASSCLLK